ncbi:MAG: outer membrane protein assembly factor BamA [Candidatus Anammoxibacter sp.]
MSIFHKNRFLFHDYTIFIVVFAAFILFTKSTLINAQNVDRYKFIKEIEIVGNKRISAAAIKSTITTKEGDIYSASSISKDVDAIWSLGFFDSIDVEVEPVTDGIKIVFQVYERSVVKSIRFIGNDRISDKKLKETISLLEHDDLKHYLLKLDENKIVKLYHSKGFLFADVKVEEKIVNGGIEINYRINEGSKVRIAQIDFKGNLSIADKKLLKFVKTSAKRFPTILFQGLFDKDQFELDIENIRKYYSQKGWLDAEVDWKAEYSNDKKSMFLTVNVIENERYFIDNITVKGQTIFSGKELLHRMQLVEGGPFLLELLDKDMFEMRLIYGEQGYSNVKIDEKHYFDADGTNVRVVYDIKENERVFIERIKITGNDKTKDNVIRRELTFLPGEYLDISKIRESQQRLINLGYFDRESGAPVSIGFEPGSKPDTQNILIEVREGRSGTLRFGGGFGANVGIFGDVSYTDRNFDIFDFPKDLNDLLSGNAFRGAGHVFSIRLAPGVQRQEATLSVFNPSVYDSPYSAGFSLFSFGRVREDFDEKRKGAKISIGKRLTKSLAVGITPIYEVITINDLDSDERFDTFNFFVPQDVFNVEGDNAKLGIQFTANMSTRDNPFLPSKGYIANASFEVAGLDIDIVKFIISGKKFHTVYDSPKHGKHTLTLSGTLGLVETTSGNDVPIFERFFAGGTGSIRGFRFRGASPRENHQQIGGDLLMLGSLEYNFPVFKNLLRGVTFLDAGKSDKDIADINLENFRAAVGFGVRLSVPILGRAVISLDWAFPIVQQDGDELQRFSFNVGQGG